MTLAERIVVMRGGHVEQIGTPDEVYNRPTTLFVGAFIGAPRMNQLPCRIDAGDVPSLVVENGPRLPLPPHLAALAPDWAGKPLVLGIRPEAFGLVGDPTAGPYAFSARISFLEPLGSDTLAFFEIGEAEVIARLPPLAHLREGQDITVTIDASKLHLFDAQTERALAPPAPS